MTDRELEELAARVEALQGQDDEVDMLIVEVAYKLRLPLACYEDQPINYDPAMWQIRHGFSPTASIDATVMLVDPSDEWEVSTMYNIARATVGLNRDHQTSWPGYGEHAGCVPVLALCAAALRAIAGREG